MLREITDSAAFLDEIDEYAALIYYSNKKSGANEITVLNQDFTRDVIPDSDLERAAQALFQTLEIEQDNETPTTSEHLAFVYFPAYAQTLCLSSMEGQGRELKTLAIAKALALVAGLDVAGLNTLTFEFDENEGPTPSGELLSKEIPQIDAQSKQNITESIFNALNSERLIENAQSGSLTVDLDNNTLSGSYIELLMDSSTHSLNKDEAMLTEKETRLMTELAHGGEVDQIVVSYEGSSDSSDGFDVMAYSKEGKVIAINHELAQERDISYLTSRLLGLDDKLDADVGVGGMTP